jgi:hypothetical protein
VKLLRTFLLASVVAAALAGSATTSASAMEPPAEANPYNPVQPVERSGVCNPLAGGYFTTRPEAPELDDTVGPFAVREVVGTARVKVQGNTSCSMAKAVLRLESKVCGMWGCHWRSVAQSDVVLLPELGEIRLQARVAPRAGSNSYRVTVEETHTVVDFEQLANGVLIPFQENKTTAYEGDVSRIEG